MTIFSDKFQLYKSIVIIIFITKRVIYYLISISCKHCCLIIFWIDNVGYDFKINNRIYDIKIYWTIDLFNLVCDKTDMRFWRWTILITSLIIVNIDIKYEIEFKYILLYAYLLIRWHCFDNYQIICW